MATVAEPPLLRQAYIAMISEVNYVVEINHFRKRITANCVSNGDKWCKLFI